MFCFAFTFACAVGLMTALWSILAKQTSKLVPFIRFRHVLNFFRQLWAVLPTYSFWELPGKFQSPFVHYVNFALGFPHRYISNDVWDFKAQISNTNALNVFQATSTLQRVTVPSLAMRSDTQQRCIIRSSRMRVLRLRYKLKVSQLYRSKNWGNCSFVSIN